MRVLLLGGYGNFGALIARELARDSGLDVVIAGRNGSAAQQLAAALRAHAGAHVHAASLDIDAPDLVARLTALAPDLVIHTCGPFQGRDYRVAHAALDVGAHYIDLADGRDFAAGIVSLDAKACAGDRLVVAGASTVPGLTAAVIDHHRSEFHALHDIDIGVSPGNRTPRGTATVAAILSYAGRPLSVWKNGQWGIAFGWQGLHRQRYPDPVGRRWLGHCDVPDHGLFPARYPGLRSLRFGAGLELGILHLGLWLLSWPERWHLLPRLDRWTHALKRISEWFLPLGSDTGAMHVALRGIGIDGQPLALTWTLVAGSGHGTQVPATAAVVLARKLANGQLAARGATPCLGLFSLDEYLAALAGFDFRIQIHRG
ncbi:MAG: saccharopine dehydrogenase NADP-binding domain-containing protein [Rudaea sp.]|nr:saccharopine dehydrogenase NADP-binding domain-containing protein [Rudaea sp.]